MWWAFENAGWITLVYVVGVILLFIGLWGTSGRDEADDPRVEAVDMEVRAQEQEGPVGTGRVYYGHPVDDADATVVFPQVSSTDTRMETSVPSGVHGEVSLWGYTDPPADWTTAHYRSRRKRLGRGVARK